MGAVTYPDAKVSAIIGREFIPVMQSPDAEPLSSDFWVRWTPALFVCDPYGNPHQRIVGFLLPDQLIPYLLLGKAKALFDHKRFNDALAALERVLSDWPQSFAAPQAVYYRAVCRYRTTHDPHHLKIGHQIILAEYPQSEWAQRTLPYRLLD
ncbi:MAG: tetratricopeptide repeat protein [Thermodesulfobacteriota bacterium]